MPTELARGPWDPGSLHGGPVAALLARELEALEAPGPMEFTRVTVELLRPVPLEPLSVRAEVVRGGRRVQLVGATMRTGDVELCRATAWRLRVAEEPVAEAVEPDPPPGAPADGRTVELPDAFYGGVTFGQGGVEARWVTGDWGLGPAQVWMRLLVPVVAEEETTPLQRAMALGDFGNGLSSVVSWDTHVFVNTELSVFLERPAQGEWLGHDAVSRVAPTGAGVAESVLFDEHGRIGRAMQALYVDRR
ncbi:MAG TPA: thioesterase family protein [Solirubrobacteraceae bacterium]